MAAANHPAIGRGSIVTDFSPEGLRGVVAAALANSQCARLGGKPVANPLVALPRMRRVEIEADADAVLLELTKLGLRIVPVD